MRRLLSPLPLLVLASACHDYGAELERCFMEGRCHEVDAGFTLEEPGGASGATLLFRSAFEAGVELGPRTPAAGGQVTQDLQGADLTGFSWPLSIFGARDSALTLFGQASARLEVVKLGTRYSRVLCLAAAGPTDGAQHNLHPDLQPDAAYVAYRLWLGPAAFDGFRVLTKLTTVADEAVVSWMQSSSGAPYWAAYGEDATETHFWEARNLELAVPMERWVSFELFFSRSAGRYFQAVDGQVVIDRRGPLLDGSTSPFKYLSFFRVAGTAARSMVQCIDNLEVYDTFPCQTPPCR